MKVAVILSSTREARVGERVAKWVMREVQKNSENEVTLVDLKDYPMPFFDEAISPQYNPDRQPLLAVQKWLDKVAAADSYIIVTPEYNRSFPAVLKNALDHIAHEAAKKPVMIASYSIGQTGGLGVQVQLRPVLSGLQMLPTPSYVMVSVVGDAITEEGETAEELAAQPYGPHTVIAKAVTELKEFSDALAVLRASN